MRRLGDSLRANRSRAAVAPAALASPSHTTDSLPAGSPSSDSLRSSSTLEGEGLSDLRRRRDELAEQVTELHWDLGGLAYEMAIRDHFRLDVLVRRAALLQERDAELAEIERLLRMEESAIAGSCPSCGAPHSRGALFCWQCGTTLMERSPSSAIDGGGTTAVMDALLTPPSAAASALAPASPASASAASTLAAASTSAPASAPAPAPKGAPSLGLDGPADR